MIIKSSQFLCLIRGIPGSGKSTLASLISKITGCKHYEADMFFVGKEGTYVHNRARQGLAHQWCLKKTEDSLTKGDSVVVSNTFVTRKEIKPYNKLASKYKTMFNVFTAKGNWISTHRVPIEKLREMKTRWQTYP